MSLSSWKKEFYSKPANKISKKDAVAHSLKKWTGLLKKNLEKHQLRSDGSSIYQIDDCYKDLDINDESCALCHHYIDNECLKCPLFKLLGHKCDTFDGPYGKWSCGNDPKPMLKALERTLKLENQDE